MPSETPHDASGDGAATRLRTLMRERAALLSRFLDFHFEGASMVERSLAGVAFAGHEQARFQKSADLKLNGLLELVESVRYSVLQEGSKRFRPVLAMFVAEALGHRPERVLPFAAAVECIHTYSLIHDDLPAMDNDDFRRGQPANHRKFGEGTAILAGDALLTEAFFIVADGFSAEPDVAVKAIAELAKASGLCGMVGGQAIDMRSKREAITAAELRHMHRLKTGALIQASALGAALLCRAPTERLRDLQIYSVQLGLAFQVADDLLDFDSSKPEPGSYPSLLGFEQTKSDLDELTHGCLQSLAEWPRSAEPLREIARFNRTRTL